MTPPIENMLSRIQIDTTISQARQTSGANADTSETESMTPSPVKHVEDKDKQTDLTATTPARITTPAKMTSPVPLTKSTDRPRRHRKPRQLYVPETGQWQPK